MSDEEYIIFLLVWAVLGLLLMLSGLISSAKIKNETQQKCSSSRSNQQRYSQSTGPVTKHSESSSTCKPIVVTNSQNENRTVNCIFCGKPMLETQSFCGTCGRRRD